MKGFLLATLALAALAIPAEAQFGSSVVYDPTQAAHALQQITQGRQLYTTQTSSLQNIIGQFNLAQRMASAPPTLYTNYPNLGTQTWTQIAPSANTYGNTAAWTSAASTGNGAAAAIQAASVPRTSRISGYNELTPQGQQALAAQGATLDLGDAVNTTTLQTIGTVRANATQREADIQKLEAATHSTDPAQQTELATLQRINEALLLQLRSQQEAMQVQQTQTMQQMVQQKDRQDGMKLLDQAADGYEANYNRYVSNDSSVLSRAFQY
jgi:hypothetical protein